LNLFLIKPQKGAKFAKFENRIFLVAFLVCMSLLFISPALGKEISIMIPRDVLAQLIRDTLPVHVPIKEKGFSGNIWIESIQNLVLGDNEVGSWQISAEKIFAISERSVIVPWICALAISRCY